MYKLTLDSGLSSQLSSDPSMKRLIAWKEAGLLEVTEVGATQGRTATPESSRSPLSPQNRWSSAGAARGRSAAITGSGNATFKALASIVFPARDSGKLRMAEINQVVFLIRHHLIKNDIFVTDHNQECIADGHRESLKNGFGIVAMTPAETVEALSKYFGPAPLG